MTRWKRFGLSLLSAIIADVIIAVVYSIPGGKYLLFERIFGFIYFTSLFVITGWLIALLVIVIPNKAAHLSTWRLGLTGTSIGPGIMIAIGIFIAIKNHAGLNDRREALNIMGITTLVSALTTAIYIKALKLFSHPTPTLSS